jgi:hypothetical protein
MITMTPSAAFVVIQPTFTDPGRLAPVSWPGTAG